MKMKQEAPNIYEQISAAVDSGDRQRLTDIFRQQLASYGGCDNQINYSANILEASINAARKDPRKMRREMLNEMLAVQGMLAHRAQEGLLAAIRQHDKETRGKRAWGDLPDEIADIWLARYGRISSEVRTTIKLLQQLDTPPAPAPGPTNVGPS
jgi:hypothetical protein